MGKPSKQKGSRFELSIKKDLSDYTGIQFERVIGSGGSDANGDIYPAYDSCYFIIELKHVESWDHSHLFESKGLVFKWWDKICKEASEANRLPLLIFKKNRKETLAATSSSGVKQLFNKKQPAIMLSNSEPEETVYIFKYEEMKKLSSPKRIIK